MNYSWILKLQRELLCLWTFLTGFLQISLSSNIKLRIESSLVKMISAYFRFCFFFFFQWKTLFNFLQINNIEQNKNKQTENPNLPNVRVKFLHPKLDILFMFHFSFFLLQISSTPDVYYSCLSGHFSPWLFNQYLDIILKLGFQKCWLSCLFNQDNSLIFYLNLILGFLMRNIYENKPQTINGN